MNLWAIFLLPALVFCGVSYGVVCFRAGRFVTAAEWRKRAGCTHGDMRLVALEWDGDAIYECQHCGKRKRVGL